uniref:Uncharacterized protein n=1 Tax=Anguilla anguilla TaxID=7936 RepID=A0A0E9WZV1_ANGAN
MFVKQIIVYALHQSAIYYKYIMVYRKDRSCIVFKVGIVIALHSITPTCWKAKALQHEYPRLTQWDCLSPP